MKNFGFMSEKKEPKPFPLPFWSGEICGFLCSQNGDNVFPTGLPQSKTNAAAIRALCIQWDLLRKIARCANLLTELRWLGGPVISPPITHWFSAMDPGVLTPFITVFGAHLIGMMKSAIVGGIEQKQQKCLRDILSDKFQHHASFGFGGNTTLQAKDR